MDFKNSKQTAVNYEVFSGAFYAACVITVYIYFWYNIQKLLLPKTKIF